MIELDAIRPMDTLASYGHACVLWTRLRPMDTLRDRTLLLVTLSTQELEQVRATFLDYLAHFYGEFMGDLSKR